jgi:hypothetical protein
MIGNIAFIPLSFNAPIVCEISNGIITPNGLLSFSIFINNQNNILISDPIEEFTLAKGKLYFFR